MAEPDSPQGALVGASRLLDCARGRPLRGVRPNALHTHAAHLGSSRFRQFELAVRGAACGQDPPRGNCRFVSHDLNEPPHVHVDRDHQSAKFWLAPVALARNLGFSAVELRRVLGLVAEHEPRLLEAWNEYFRG